MDSLFSFRFAFCFGGFLVTTVTLRNTLLGGMAFVE
jgi:hypothetical protein